MLYNKVVISNFLTSFLKKLFYDLVWKKIYKKRQWKQWFSLLVEENEEKRRIQ